MISTQTLIDLNSPFLQFIHGPQDLSFSKVVPPEQASQDSLVFVNDKVSLSNAIQKGANPIVLGPKLNDAVLDIAPLKEIAFFKTPHIQHGMRTVLELLDKKALRFAQTQNIHPTAIISPTAQIGAGCVIGPYSVIGDFVEVGVGTRIGANSVIERHARIGNNCTIHPLVFIGAECVIGNACEIHPQTSIGSDGYGYATDKEGHHHKIPQVGNVILEDHVEIGSCCAIDRATLTSTRIGRGTKLDNLVHIAHNCEIGPDNFLTAGFMTAGSTKTGRLFITGGNTVVADHITIGDNVLLAGRSTVTSDILEAGQYGGHPVQPMKEYLRNLSSVTQLAEMRKTLNKIVKHLGLSQD